MDSDSFSVFGYCTHDFAFLWRDARGQIPCLGIGYSQACHLVTQVSCLAPLRGSLQFPLDQSFTVEYPEPTASNSVHAIGGCYVGVVCVFAVANQTQKGDYCLG